MKIGGYQFESVRRIGPSLGAAFVRKGDALLFARESEGGGYELELLALEGFKTLRRSKAEGVTGVAPVGEGACLVTVRPGPRERRDSPRMRKLEVRALKDFKPLAAVVEDKVGHVAASPDGAFLAVAHDFGPLNVWDARTGGLLAAYESKGVGGVAYSRDGALLAAKEFAGALKIFDGTGPSAEPLRSVAAGAGEAEIAFHPSRPLVAAAAKNAIKLVDAEAGRVTASLKLTKSEGRGGVGQMAFSPDGRLLVTATLSDGVVGLWDVEEAEFLGHLTKSEAPLNRVEFDAGGKYLLVSSYDAAELYEVSEA